MPPGVRSLDELRREIDRIDAAIHELLMQRTSVVLEVSRAKGTGAGTRAQFFRPGREAQVLRQLVERHSGAFPQAALVRIWREMMSGQLRVQTEVTVAVCAGARHGGLWDTARDQYGAAARYRAYAHPREVVAAVRAGEASIGVLPLPQDDGAEDDGERPWWPLLAEDDAPRILSQLPFIADGGGTSGLAIGFGEPDPSDHDRGCLVVQGETRPAAASGIFEACGVRARCVAESDGGRTALFETDGLLLPGDDRLDRLRKQAPAVRVTPIGGYAVPILSGQFARTEVA